MKKKKHVQIQKFLAQQFIKKYILPQKFTVANIKKMPTHTQISVFQIKWQLPQIIFNTHFSYLRLPKMCN